MGGIYIGAFTPTEAAGIGATGAFALAAYRRQLNYAILRDILVDTAKTSASLFAVVISALILSNFINRAGLPTALIEMIQAVNVSPMMALGLIILIYIILGCVFESMSMMLLTVPIFFPVVVELGFDPIWFGIVVVVVTEISLITPPVGLNVFVLSGIIKDINTATIFKGSIPVLGGRHGTTGAYCIDASYRTVFTEHLVRLAGAFTAGSLPSSKPAFFT